MAEYRRNINSTAVRKALASPLNSKHFAFVFDYVVLKTVRNSTKRAYHVLLVRFSYEMPDFKEDTFTYVNNRVP